MFIKHSKIILFSLALFIVGNIAYAITIQITARVPGCGDGVIQEGEQCDGTNYGGSTCSSLGFVSGNLSCSSACTTDTSNCSMNPLPPKRSGGSSSYVPPTNVVFSGFAYPGSVVTLLKDSQIISTVVSNKAASFQTTISGISTGNYLFSLYSEDKDGVRSPLFTFPMDILSGSTIKISNVFIAPTLSLKNPEIKKEQFLNLFGYTTPNSNVEFYYSNTEEVLHKYTSNEDGYFNIDLDTNFLKSNIKSIKARTYHFNEKSDFSKTVSYEVDSQVMENVYDKKIDINSDGKINLVDLSIVSFWYKKSNPLPSVDLNKDGVVNLVDLSILIYHWTG